MCPACTEKNNENRRRNREYRARIGFCTVCGQNKAEPHRKMCYECLGKEQDRYQATGKTQQAKENDRLRKQESSKKRLLESMCPRCGKHKSVNGGLCGRCRAYGKRYRDNNRQDIARSERPDYGICYICGKKEVLDGKKVCADCYETRLKTLPAMWENMNNEYFKQLNYSRIMMIRERSKAKSGST